MKGSLPWQGIQCKDKAERNNKIMRAKMETPLNIICKKLPEEILNYMKYCRALTFEEKPNYNMLRRTLKNSLSLNESYTNKFDWLEPDEEEELKRAISVNFTKSFNKEEDKVSNNMGFDSTRARALNINNGDKDDILKKKNSLAIPSIRSGICSSYHESNGAERDLRGSVFSRGHEGLSSGNRDEIEEDGKW